MRLTDVIIGCIVLTLTILPVKSSLATIGEVTQLEGKGVIDRQDGEDDIVIEKQLDIFSYDTVKTGNGKVGIEFIDATRVDVTQHSKLLIDEFVYDPNTKTGKLSLKAKLGTVRYASGQIAKNSATDVKITTPTATIGVRGTDFTMTIDEVGSSTIILLPSCNGAGNCFVGEISVESDAGQVILNQAFQATQVDTPESSPLKPVLLDLDETLINNLLIVQKPPALADAIEQEEKLKSVANALDIDFLKFDDLEVDLLETEEDEAVTALEIDFLDQNFLVDILAQLNKQLAIQMQSAFDKKKKTKTGQDEFGVILLDEEPEWVWMRSDEAGNNIVLRLNQENGYIINVTQGDMEIRDYQLGEGDNEIYINQR